eukprot:CAMPEP_0203867936 /NCGR_PEP_ID=MMETSP0359-20131031/16817_1 /ASSEMBLY_ACC=CAM_ASM_000338 /TAXON_ID=268821 /ORGANISM="Scrippsiella Hangoei, Strain SHTV-5" /LENGTH=476 /DNA_ID=CAMNT_0050786273 /DNA_START=66 /DNA_END=1496 /DNA_ORIENTATION=+
MGKCFYGWFIYPEKLGWPATLFAVFVGGLGWLIEYAAIPRDMAGNAKIPSVMIALVLGMIISNIPPVRACLGIDGGRIKWSDGLGFIDKMLLRGAVILLGFSLQSELLTSNWQLLLVSVLICAIVQPLVYFVTQLSGRAFKLSPEARDMLSVGTIICGASAITAFQAVLLNAQRQTIMPPGHKADSMSFQEQKKKQEEKVVKYAGLCTSAVFVYSLVALVALRFIAAAAGFSAQISGLWAGLAVNDLSSAIAVGSEFGSVGQEFAIMSKTVRILTLAPHLLWLGFRAASREQALIQTEGRDEEGGGARPAAVPFTTTLWANFPLFMGGFMVLFFVRVTLDLSLTSADGIAAINQTDGILKHVAKGLMNTVTAGIGLRLKVQDLAKAWKYVLVEGIAWTVMESVSFSLLVLHVKMSDESDVKFGLVCGVGSGLVLIGSIVYCLCRKRPADEARELQDQQLAVSRTRGKCSSPQGISD